MRSLLALVATGSTAVAALVSALDGGGPELAFFAALTAAGLVAAGALTPLAGAPGKVVAAMVAAAWTTAGVWIGVLLLMFQAACGCSRPEPPAEATYLGLTATTYHLLAMYGSNALIVVAAFGRSAFLNGSVGRSAKLG
jgi:hypothetical protein